MHVSTCIRIEQRLSHHLSGEGKFPDLAHRFYLINDFDAGSVHKLVEDMADTASASLELLIHYVGNTQARCLDSHTIYYGLHSVRKELGDIRTVVATLRSECENDDALDLTEAAMQRLDDAEGVIELLCHTFSEDNRPDKSSVCQALASVPHQLDEIVEVLNKLRLMR